MTISRKNNSLRHGFTLLEVLIAVMIFAIVLAAINTIFFSALRLRNNAEAALQQSQPVEIALTTIKRDLANLVPPSGPLSGSLQSTTTSNNIPNRISPDFYTATGIVEDTYSWGDIQRVTYQLMDSTNGNIGKDLYRAVSRNLLALNQDQPTEQWLMSGVDNVLFYYYDGAQWQTAWDSTTQTNLPLAIKVQIQLSSRGTIGNAAQNTPLELFVPIDAQGPTNLVASTGGTQ